MGNVSVLWLEMELRQVGHQGSRTRLRHDGDKSLVLSAPSRHFCDDLLDGVTDRGVAVLRGLTSSMPVPLGDVFAAQSQQLGYLARYGVERSSDSPSVVGPQPFVRVKQERCS